MEQENNLRRERLIQYIKANNPLFMFAHFEYYSLEKLEKLKHDIDYLKKEREKQLQIHLN